MRASLTFHPLPTRRKWAIETEGHRISAEFRNRRLTWTWPTGEGYVVEFTSGGIDIYQDSRLRVRRVGPWTLKGHVIRRWELDGTPLVQRHYGCLFPFRVEGGPLVMWLRAGVGLRHPFGYPAAWQDRLPLLCGMAMAALYNYD